MSELERLIDGLIELLVRWERPNVVFSFGLVSEQQQQALTSSSILMGARSARSVSYAAASAPMALIKRSIVNFTLSDSQHSTFSIAFADKKGNPVAAPTGASMPVWSVDNQALLALTPSADGFTCDVASVGPLGSGTVSVAVAAADGTPFAAGSLAVDVVSGAPTTIVLEPSAPIEQTPTS